MSFREVEFVRTLEKNEARVSISYQRRATEGERKGSPRLVVGIPANIANGSKIKDGDLFGISIGDGRDAGKGRILKVAGGGVAARKMASGAIVFRFGFVPMLGAGAAAKEFTDGKAIDGGFEIALPAWFKAD